ncbi:hypothetical protein B0I35DRAFT_423685 [Stachybotrys elegans]|uniref:DUF3533 domain-containing protein n=1 Tax=Stachybotrys elegans TaxID=80388 RepID=A0A8K0T125_9HYPO|nr:hypothetical protein B0I35DRAFT_423685 [Stachybotrys elegans]
MAASTTDSAASATLGRVSLRHSSWNGQRKGIFIPLVGAAVMLYLVFLGDMSYLFGTTFHQRDHIHALNVLVIDFDGGAISEALSNTYQHMQGAGFPTLDFQSASGRYSDPAAVRDAVCSGDYWGAMYTHAGASDELASAVSGGPGAADYAPNNTVSYIYNQARYPTIADNALGANLRALVTAAREAYYGTDQGREALANLDRADAGAVQAFLNPFQPSAELITPTMQGSRAYYNTLNVVFPILLTFFFLLVVNGISIAKGLPLRLRRRDFWILRFVVSKAYAFFAALIITAYTWAFREDWAVGSHVFATNWMIVWFLIDINWQVFDATIGAYVPMELAPIFMMTWVLMNVASAAFPLQIAPGFYRIGFAFPAYNIYSLQVQAWSGCANELHIALPVLFTWWVLGHIAAVFAVRKRCADAEKAAMPVVDEPAQHKQADVASVGLDTPKVA